MSPETPVLSPASSRALELPTLVALVAQRAVSDFGRCRILGLEPTAAADELHRRRCRLEEAERLLGDGPLIPLFEEPLEPLVAGLRQGRASVAGADLVRLREILQTTARAASRIDSADPPVAALAELAARLPDLSALTRRIGKTLDRRGEVREDASPELVRLRRRVQRLRSGLYEQLHALISRHREHLAEDTVPLRAGRLVLVLRSGARGRVDGLLHGRSATGKSFYFEPFEVVEANNQLQQMLEEEAEERRRILAELTAEVRGELPAVDLHLDFLAEMDLLQAACRFGEISEGRLVELAPAGGELRLVAARHPLLDPRLAELRRGALGQPGHRSEVVPLDLELPPDARLLVVTGPNAGGKTVALKTVGLAAAASQCGLPVPTAAGSRLPVFRRIVATVGDEQDLLADRSTFSGRLLRLREAWEAAGPESLLLLDELGSGTEPEEGAALAIALMEGLLGRSAAAVITTHLTQLAASAMERPGAGCAAMEFDPSTGQPTYRLVAGPPGGSEALALARRLGLAAAWLDRAEELLGSDYRDLRRLLSEVEGIRRELLTERSRAEREAKVLAAERDAVRQQQEALEDQRRSLARRLKRELEEFRKRVRTQLAAEVERLRRDLETGRRKGLAAEAAARLFGDAPVLETGEVVEDAGELVVGGRVRHQSLGWEGVLERLDGERAEVVVRGKRVRCASGELVAAAGEAREGPPVRVRARAMEGSGAPAELNLIGWRVEPALGELDTYLDSALLSARREVRVIHGHGSGRLREAVREHLKGHPAVADQRPGARDEGGDGATVVTLRL